MRLISAASRWGTTSAAFLMALLLAVTACGSDVATTDPDEDIIIEIPTNDDDPSDDGEGGADQSAGGADFMTIWPVPPMGEARMDGDFGGYEINDLPQGTREFVSFLVADAELQPVVDYYTMVLEDEGYTVNTLPLTETATSLFAEKEGYTSSISIGHNNPSDPTLRITQERTDTMSADASSDSGSDDGGEAEAEAEAVESDLSESSEDG